MIKFIRLLFLVLIIQACKPTTQTDTDLQVFVPGQKHIALMNPTVNNLRTFLFLTGEGIFPLPQGYRVVGVYHQNAIYDFQQSSDFIKEEGLSNFALLGISPVLDTESLYRENECTPHFREIFEKSDGVIFFGGPDLPPATYGEPLSLLTVITDPNRHYLELSFMFHLLGGSQNNEFTPFLEEKTDFRILGICLGMQTMNVATGGTMVQDIPFEIYGFKTVEEVLEADQQLQHRNYYAHYSLDKELFAGSFHQVEITGGQMAAMNQGLAQWPFVLSSHHQAAEIIGRGLKVTAWSMDGKIVEALEHEKYPHVMGIQFHPEVRDIFIPENKLRMRPNEPGTQSYSQLYPGEMGLTFHQNFWNHIGGWFSAKAN